MTGSIVTAGAGGTAGTVEATGCTLASAGVVTGTTTVWSMRLPITMSTCSYWLKLPRSEMFLNCLVVVII